MVMLKISKLDVCGYMRMRLNYVVHKDIRNICVQINDGIP